jgi:hypothetical protein
MALKRVWMPTGCYSSRGGQRVDKVCLHTAEGARDIYSLGNFFANQANQVSSHTGADDSAGKIGEYVTRGNAAWTQANYNPQTVALELCGFASWNRDTWLNSHRNMLDNAAAWIAEECAHYGIPVVALNNSQAQGSARGVCEHVNFGAGGGGHVDCGSPFPMDYVLDKAKGGGGAAAVKEDDMAAAQPVPWDPSWRTGLSFSNDEADGKHRLFFSCREPAKLRVDTRGHGGTQTLTLGLNEGRQGFALEEGCKFVVVKLDEPATTDPDTGVVTVTGPTSTVMWGVSA